jgi:hypothetical protein
VPTAATAIDPVVAQLQAAALAAICALSYDAADPAHDPNPHTARLTPYDLARLFSNDPSGRRRHTATTLDDIAGIVRHSRAGLVEAQEAAMRRRDRSLWVLDELRRLGHHTQAVRFAASVIWIDVGAGPESIDEPGAPAR